MPMNDAELTEAVLELRDAFLMLAAGCQEIADAVGNQTRLLVEIKEAVTAEPDEPNLILNCVEKCKKFNIINNL
jgi:hypothetical protein